MQANLNNNFQYINNLKLISDLYMDMDIDNNVNGYSEAILSKPNLIITRNTNKRKTPPNVNQNKIPNKKPKNDNDIINLLLNNNPSTSDSDDDCEELECNNPLCDHKDYTKEEKTSKRSNDLPLMEIKTIEDLINLGKMYHCKKNTVYYGINLRLLCNLVTPLTKLKNMVGMKSVKENMVNQIVFFLQGFNQKEKCNACLDCTYGLPCSKNMNNDMLHTVITGPPGVGKTELGKILGEVYKAMGILSKGHMNIATRSVLIGKYLGHTAQKTQDFINKCKGGVMFIDEAYSLGNPEGRDSFSKECLDTINQNLSEKRDFLCIIAGYGNALEKCFFQYNEGLKRRFSFRYDIQGYTADELMEIFLMKVKLDNWKTEFDVNEKDSVGVIRSKEQNRLKLKEFFRKNKRHMVNYGGDIESLLLNCKVVHGKRVLFLTKEHKKVYTMVDIEEGFKTFVSHRKNKNADIKNDEEIHTIYQS